MCHELQMTWKDLGTCWATCSGLVLFLRGPANCWGAVCCDMTLTDFIHSLIVLARWLLLVSSSLASLDICPFSSKAWSQRWRHKALGACWQVQENQKCKLAIESPSLTVRFHTSGESVGARSWSALHWIFQHACWSVSFPHVWSTSSMIFTVLSSDESMSNCKLASTSWACAIHINKQTPQALKSIEIPTRTMPGSASKTQNVSHML